MDPTLILGGIKLLGGLFGKKKKTPTPAQNILSQAQGARQAAETYGFNPLTMLQYGQPGGAMGGGGEPPLASTELLLGGLDDVTDVLSGEKARREASNKLEYELRKITLDQMRSGVAAVGLGPSPLGNRPSSVVQRTGGPVGGGFNVSADRLGDPVVLQAAAGGGIAVPDVRLDRGSGGYVEGYRLESTPGWSPASVFENDYGDVGQAVYGLAKLGRDIVYTAEHGRKRYLDKHTVGSPLRLEGDAYPPGSFPPPPDRGNPWHGMFNSAPRPRKPKIHAVKQY